MALTNNEWCNLKYAIIRTRRSMKKYDEYSEPWTRDRLLLEKLLNQKAENRSLPKKGDLITDAEWPDGGVALVLEVGDRRKKRNAYRALCASGSTEWFGREYIEYNCFVISS